MNPDMKSILLISVMTFAVGCGSSGGGDDDVDAGLSPDAAVRRAPEIGTGDGTPASITLTEIAGPAARLQQPRDLAFNPMRPDELWVVNYRDDSVTIIHDASKDSRTTEYRKDGYALHFMAEVTAIAFGQNDTTARVGKPGTFGTCGESRNHYDNMAAPNDFMGPALWSSDPTIFAKLDPMGLGSHLDMLHYAPNCMGIAHETANKYWVFAGLSKSIMMFDFGLDDGIGNDNHSDGKARQYAAGAVGYVANTPSHLVFDPSDSMLYIADTGNHRIARLDTTSGTVGAALNNFERIAEFRRVDGAVIEDVVPAGGTLDAPSGLELHGDYLYVTDNRTAKITAFTKTGEQVNQVDTGLGPGALGGITFGPDGKVYIVDMLNDRVFRLDP